MKNLLLSLSLCLSFTFALTQPLLEKVISNEINFAFSDGVRLADDTWLFSAFAYSITPGDSAMAMLVKTDSSFSPLWAKRYKYLRRDDFSCITLLSDGNVLVGGTMRQNFSIENGGSIFKLDTAGNVIWHLLYDEDFDDRVLDIFEQADSSLMIFIREGVNNRPSKLVHASKNGSILNQRTYTVGSNQGLLANSVVTDENEQYYFSGSVFDQGVSQLFVAAVDDTSLLWHKRFRFGDRSVGSFQSTYVPSDQSILLGGSITDTVGIFVNIWLAKLDLMGNVKWMKEYGGDLGYTENVSGLKPLPNGDFMMHGSVFDDQGSEGFVIRLDSTGNILWQKAYNPVNPRFGIADLFFLPDGRMLLNGNSGQQAYLMTTSVEGQSACNTSALSLNMADLMATDSIYPLSLGNPGIQEVLSPLEVSSVAIQDSLLCMASVGIPEPEAKQLQVFPNPAQDQLTIMLPLGGGPDLQCAILDAMGRKYKPLMRQNDHQIELDLSTLSSGLYWYYLSVGSKLYTGNFVRE